MGTSGPRRGQETRQYQYAACLLSSSGVLIRLQQRLPYLVIALEHPGAVGRRLAPALEAGRLLDPNCLRSLSSSARSAYRALPLAP